MDKITEKISEKIDEISKKQEEQDRLIEELFNKLSKIKVKSTKSIKTFEELYKENFDSFFNEVLLIRKKINENADYSLFEEHKEAEEGSVYFHLAECLLFFDLEKIASITTLVNETTDNPDWKIETRNVETNDKNDYINEYKNQIQNIFDSLIKYGEANRSKPVKRFQSGRFILFSIFWTDTDITNELIWAVEQERSDI